MIPLLEPDPSLGQVVVTRFECGTLPKLVAMLTLHRRVKRSVRRRARGLIDVKTAVDWRRRTMLSISLWQDLESVYSMGNVPDHVAAARVPGSTGVRTASGVFCYVGDWRRVMFQSPSKPRSPLHPLPSRIPERKIDMPSGNERGHAVLSQREDGRTTVAVCTAIKNGRPENIYAKFVGVDDVRIGAGIRLTRGDSFRYTREIVVVSADKDGVVHVRAIDSSRGLPLD
jgi:hypothetical protein